ncbi:hypothetical protein [Christiangramia sp.]|uniref:hypothetical protein n=1 Tax=Christiangramia sp. TaxID=1931228 RepID=UPI00261E3215|nr:hypothetical protein [Christiangramia sp.]
MKRFKIVLVFILLSIALACDKDMDDIDRSTAEANELNLIVQQGEWKISHFSMDGSDRTANYKDYLFLFGEENNLTATSSTDQITGTWRINTDAGGEHDSYNDVDFNIFFSSSEKFGELTRNYDVISATENDIKLYLLTGENEEMVSLSFSKN